MRWRTVLQRLQQEAKLGFFFFSAYIERAKYFRLHILAVYTHRAAADFPPVQHHIVCLGMRFAGIGIEQILVPVERRSKRMMHRIPALRILIPLEHRKVEYPQRPPARLGIALLVADLDAQGAERIVDHLGAAGAEEDQIAALRTGPLAYA